MRIAHAQIAKVKMAVQPILNVAGTTGAVRVLSGGPVTQTMNSNVPSGAANIACEVHFVIVSESCTSCKFDIEFDNARTVSVLCLSTCVSLV